MLEEMVSDYASYLKLELSNGFQTVQDVIDNMLTRLEELTSVLQMIKLKNTDCSTAVSDDINKYRSEVSALSKKILTIIEVIAKLQNNVDLIEKQVEKAEVDFGVNNDSKIKSLFKPFMKRSREASPGTADLIITPPRKLELLSVMDNFENNNSIS
ncbi:uncharacterized protein ACR2FA_004747 [Aphomia sociella]